MGFSWPRRPATSRRPPAYRMTPVRREWTIAIALMVAAVVLGIAGLIAKLYVLVWLVQRMD